MDGRVEGRDACMPGLGASPAAAHMCVCGGRRENGSCLPRGRVKTGRHHGCAGSGSPEGSVLKGHPFCVGLGLRARLAVQKRAGLSPTEASQWPGIKAEELGPGPPPPSRLGCHSLAFPARQKWDPGPRPRPCEHPQGSCGLTLERARGLSAKFQLNPQALII